jgi:hypothetical protein
VDDSLLVRGGEPGGDLRGELEGLADGHRACVDAASQIASLDELADEVRRLPLTPHVVDGDDVGVGEGGSRARLAREPCDGRGSSRSMTVV